MRRTVRVGAMLLLVLCLAACPKDTYRKVLEAENGVAQSIGAGTNIVSDLYDKQVIDRQEKNAVAGALLDANRLLATFNNGAKKVHAAGDSKAAYLALAEELSAGIRKLNESGTLRIKSAEARAQVDALFASIQAAVAILKTTIQGGN